MDRAEAVKILETQLDVTSVNTPSCIELHEALDLAIEALQESQTTHDQMDACYMAQKSAVEKHQLSGETSTNWGVSEDGKTSWFVESATTTDCNDCIWNTCNYNKIDWDLEVSEDCISRADIEYHTQLEANGNGQYEEVEVAYKRDIDNLPSVVPDFKTFCGVPIEEAIDVLEKYKHAPNVTPTDKVVDFNNMVSGGERIRNLPPVTPTRQQEHGRQIDADALIENIKQSADYKNDVEYLMYANSFIDDINNAPTVITPTERSGEWVEVQGCKSYLCCSECGRFVNVAHKCNFCPHCGAKMGGDTE